MGATTAPNKRHHHSAISTSTSTTTAAWCLSMHSYECIVVANGEQPSRTAGVALNVSAGVDDDAHQTPGMVNGKIVIFRDVLAH
ncbi:unnamed protein product [Ceratitis capitata]|uniref:(Mediterranean fruit fly) hypothetical protein n=1 Tax=Ceratitis capitata TaxID=7213 RepID=A0A811UAS8_CERCA|nr:unnamed protein product [Ceratitis capitata]